MKAKVVFHLDWEKEENLIMALNNIKNLLKEIPAEEASIYLVANGASARLFCRERALSYAPDMERLSREGVRFLVCNNSLNNFGIGKDEIVESCEVIPGGILELIRLQNEGYAYIKP